MRGVAIELELEIARAGIFLCIDDAAIAFDFVVESDRMPDGDAIEPLASGKEARNVIVRQIVRKPRINPADIFGHAVEEIRAYAPQQRIQDRLVDLRRAIGRGKRWDVLLRTSLDLRGDARRMQAERGVEALVPEIQIPRDHERTPQLFNRFLRRKLRPLVEPFWHQELGAGP